MRRYKDSHGSPSRTHHQSAQLDSLSLLRALFHLKAPRSLSAFSSSTKTATTIHVPSSHPTMSYRAHQYEALRRLGVEQLPTLFEPAQHDHDETPRAERRCSEPRNSFEANEPRNPFAMNLAIRERPVRLFPQQSCIDSATNIETGTRSQMSHVSRPRTDILGRLRQAMRAVRNRVLKFRPRLSTICLVFLANGARSNLGSFMMRPLDMAGVDSHRRWSSKVWYR